jgi:hypothetical protein
LARRWVNERYFCAPPSVVIKTSHQHDIHLIIGDFPFFWPDLMLSFELPIRTACSVTHSHIKQISFLKTWLLLRYSRNSLFWMNPKVH